MKTRKKSVKKFLWSILTYGRESWTPGKVERDKQAAKMWNWNRVTKAKIYLDRLISKCN